MSNKKRKLSPTLSSRSSPTPGPSSGTIPATASSPPADNLPLIATSASRAGSASVSGDATPILYSQHNLSVAGRSEMKMPTITHGSGDGVGSGDECFVWQDLPNQSGYRYLPCALSPIQSPNPSYPFYRTIPPPTGTPKVHLSWLDRSPYLHSSPDALTATTDRGFRSARANVAVREGTWYYEVYIERGDGNTGVGKGTSGGDVPNPHVRIGWGRREAILDAPVGLDAYSYGLRDVGCEKIHLSRRKVYGDPNRHLRTGDTVGCLITLPPRPKTQSNGRNSDPAVITRNRAPLKFKGQMYLESEEYRPAREMEAKVDREGKLAKEAAEAARLATIETNIEDPEPGAKVSKGKGKTKQKQTKSKSKIKGLESGNHDIEIDRTPTTLEGSSISFFLNGAPMSDEPAFRDLYDFIPLPPHSSTNVHQGKKGEPVKGLQHDDGTLGYYPMISVFGRGKVKLNFGPTFHAPPPTVEGVRPMCDRYDEFREEERIQDELDELEWIERINHDLKEAEDKREVLIKRKLAADLRKRGGGRGRGRGGSASTPTPRSRLGTESTPGPGYGGLGVEDSPKSEPGLGGLSVKREVEVESVGGAESRAQSQGPGQDEDLPGLELPVTDAMPDEKSGMRIGGETERRPELDIEMDAEGEEEEQDNKPIDWEYFTS